MLKSLNIKIIVSFKGEQTNNQKTKTEISRKNKNIQKVEKIS